MGGATVSSAAHYSCDPRNVTAPGKPSRVFCEVVVILLRVCVEAPRLEMPWTQGRSPPGDLVKAITTEGGELQDREHGPRPGPGLSHQRDLSGPVSAACPERWEEDDTRGSGQRAPHRQGKPTWLLNRK